MAGFLASVGTLTYNGITFPNQVSCRVQVRSVADTARRHTKYTEWTLNVETIFHDPNGVSDQPHITTDLDTDLPTVRKKLEHSGAILVFSGKGLGTDLSINTSIVEVAYGPFPEVLAWEFIGNNSAVRCVWAVTFRIPESSDQNVLLRRLLELNYAIAWDITESGLTRRLINGQMELAVPRSSVISESTRWRVTDTVDRFRENFQAEIPVGFARVSQNWSLSPDKRICTFTIVDEEIPSDNPYYPGTIRPRINHAVASHNMSFAQWNNTLSGTIEVALGYPRWFAWAAFLLVLQKRLNAASAARKRDGTGCPDNNVGVQLIQAISFNEEVFGRSTAFSVSWLLTCSLDTLMQASGLWEVNDEITWAGYRQSMAETSGNWSHRGNAQMFHSVNDDALVAFESTAPQSIYVSANVARGLNENGYSLLSQPCPPPDNSWLVFSQSITLIPDHHIVHHKTLTDPESLDLQTPSPSATTVTNQSGASIGTTAYRRSDSTYRVRVRGYAMRVCYKVPRVHIASYGGVPVELDSSYQKPVQEDREITTLMHPVYLSRWDKVYVCQGTPNNIDTNLNEDCFGP